MFRSLEVVGVRVEEKVEVEEDQESVQQVKVTRDLILAAVGLSVLPAV
jgi:hypothetical protein